MERALKEGGKFDEQLTKLAEAEITPALLEADSDEEDQSEEAEGSGDGRGRSGSGRRGRERRPSA